MTTPPSRTVSGYINNFPAGIRERLKHIRATIKQIAPDAEEGISYAMPAYKLNGKPLVYFAGYRNHIGLYATPSGHSRFAKELSPYKQGKGSVQFPADQPLPLGLVEKIVRFKANENRKNTASSYNKKQPSGALNSDTGAYNAALPEEDRKICTLLAYEINRNLPEAENKIWHGHPVWFLEGNPVVGYSKLKDRIRLMFWSGQSFNEEKLVWKGKKFRDASINYSSVAQINIKDLKRWLKKSRDIHASAARMYNTMLNAGRLYLTKLQSTKLQDQINPK